MDSMDLLFLWQGPDIHVGNAPPVSGFYRSTTDPETHPASIKNGVNVQDTAVPPFHAVI